MRLMLCGQTWPPNNVRFSPDDRDLEEEVRGNSARLTVDVESCGNVDWFAQIRALERSWQPVASLQMLFPFSLLDTTSSILSIDPP